MKQTAPLLSAFRAAFPVTLPVLTGFLVLGIAYGILMSTKGYGPLWSFAFSAIAFCGSMQFVAIPFLTSTFAPLDVFFLSLMVNARHLFYGLSMLDKYNGTGPFKFPLIYYLCDENFAINSTAVVPQDIKASHFYFAVTMLDVFYWASASLLGGVIGKMLTINTKGLDFALTALFIVLFLEQLKNTQSRICGCIGVIASMIALFSFGSNNMVIGAMILILAALLVGRKKICHYLP